MLATQPTGHKVTICHATSSETNPYVNPTVDIASAGYGDKAGHAGHGRDGVWYPGAKADGFDWGDIIPPYDYGDFHYAGLNWTTAGQTIYDNGCKVPEEPAHNPKIHIVKSPSVTSLPAGGGSVTYTYHVTATGNVPLSDVSVSDDKCSPVSYVSGDTNDDDFLDLSETWVFTCAADLTETTTNTAVATGYDGEDKVSDDDDATVTVAPTEQSAEPSSPPELSAPSSEPSSEPSSPPELDAPSQPPCPDCAPGGHAASPSPVLQGGVGAETDTPTAPPTDVAGISSASTPTIAAPAHHPWRHRPRRGGPDPATSPPLASSPASAAPTLIAR